MSPSRRQQFVPSRPRSEIIIAVAVGVGIVAGTALLIWLMRPGPTGVQGGGGLFSRQPRMVILLLLAFAALGGVIWYVGRGRRGQRFGTRGAIAIGTVLVIVIAIAAGIFWPGGVVRHWPSQPQLAPTPTTNPVSVPSSVPATTPTTAAKTGTTVKAAPTPTSGG